MANLGPPVKLLHESLGHIITVELKTGQVYRGKLFDGELRARGKGKDGGWRERRRASGEHRTVVERVLEGHSALLLL